MKPTDAHHRIHPLVAILLAWPLLIGADGTGCDAGGTIPIGSGIPNDGGGDVAAGCAPSDCAGLPAPQLAETCPDGSAVGATVCVQLADGKCGWGFPPCPGPTDASATSCTLQASAYAQSCQVDSDCETVFLGDVCNDVCHGDCPTAAINRSASTQYAADLVAARNASPPPTSACSCAPALAVCRAGACAIERTLGDAGSRDAGAGEGGCVSQQGGHCGGNTAQPCACAVGLVCTPGDSGLPFGDVGGICEPPADSGAANADAGIPTCGPTESCVQYTSQGRACLPKCSGVDASGCPASEVCTRTSGCCVGVACSAVSVSVCCPPSGC